MANEVKSSGKTFFRECGQGIMAFLDWTTGRLQIKILLAMVVLAGIAIYCIEEAVAIYVADTLKEDFTVFIGLLSLANFSLGAMAGIAKDLLTPPPGKSEGYELFMQHMELEHKDN